MSHDRYSAVPFPTVTPPSFEYFDDEVEFDPARHLALEDPSEIVMLADLGYSPEEIEGTATPVAASAPFRVLSDEGVEVMLATARRLREFTKAAGDRIERSTRGGVYRSRWLRDLCLSPDVSCHLSTIYGTDVAPHPMGHHLGHLNYEPSAIDTAIDKWHHDTLPLDYVLTVHDPGAVQGGRFEYFAGTKAEAAALAEAGELPPPERTVAPDFPGPGFAIALHGNMVVHRAAPLTELAERITMVNGYVALDRSIRDQSRSQDLITVDPHEALWTEWATFAAWRAHGRLGSLIENPAFTSDRESVIAELESAVSDVHAAIEAMRGDGANIAHYGG